MSKQDRQGVRTPADIERKYNLGEVRRTFEDVRSGANVEKAIEKAIAKAEAKIQLEVDAKLDDYATKDDLGDYVHGDDMGDYALKDDLKNYALKTEIPNTSDFVTSAELDAVTKVIETSVSEVDTRLKYLASAVQDITDGQWYDLTLGTGFIARGNNSTLSPKVKASGAVITVCGIVSNSAAMTVPSEGVVIASGIPEEWRPHMDHHFVCQSANMDLWRCAVKTDGTVTLARLGTTAARDLGANTWLPFTVTYQI